MGTNELIELCERYKNDFYTNVTDFHYEAKGIINSELLLLVSLAKHYRVSAVIESGRARGYSTKIIASTLPECSIVSVEYDRFSYDSLIAMRNLKRFQNIQFVYGDASVVLPPLITGKSIVLIDGPKGASAVKLAAQLLTNSAVQAVLVHDLHKDSPHRALAEAVFSNSFFTDNVEYVGHFKDIDESCWKRLGQYPKTKNWGPYQRGNRKMKSYSATLACFFNSAEPLKEDALGVLNAFSDKAPERLLLEKTTSFVMRAFKYGLKRLKRAILVVPIVIYEKRFYGTRK